MTETERKALALVNEVQKVRGHTGSPWNSPAILNEALYRAIEQHEALGAENMMLREERDRLIKFVNIMCEEYGLEYDGVIKQ